MTLDDNDLKVVAAAFDRLLDKIEASACSSDDWHTVGRNEIDVLDILAGKWDEPVAEWGVS